MDNKTYTARLVLSSPARPASGMQFSFEWDPPLADVLAEFGEDKMPYSYDYMAHLLESKVLRDLMFSDNYEAMLVEDPQLELEFKENPVENPERPTEL